MTVIEIHVILFHLSGLKERVSRFQVISMMTGTGFTTGESEQILSHPFRRKLGIFLILFGAFSLAVIISSVSSLLEDDLRNSGILYVAGVVFFLFAMLKTPFLKNSLLRYLEYKSEEKEKIPTIPLREVTLEEEYRVFEFQVKGDSPYINNTLKEIMEKKETVNFALLFIKRDDVKIRYKLDQEKLQTGDQLYLFGGEHDIEKVFEEENDS